MKKTFIILSAALICFCACDIFSPEDLLDKTPQSKISPTDFFSTETELQLYTNPLYDLLNNTESFKRSQTDKFSDHFVESNLTDEQTGTRSAVETGYDDHVRMRLCDACCNRADSCLRDEFHRHAGVGIRAFEVVDELGEVFDGVDVVVRRRRDERSTGLCMAEPRYKRVNLVGGELPAFAGLCALGELDLEILGGAYVFNRHAESAGGYLLYRAVPLGAEALRVFAAFAGVGHRAKSV